uniref:DNA polymerase epsilon catalytic subunit n=1 Tax=Meloidogyne incognita TaxID=6306 RepID=A0A914NES5_MELIC
MTLNLFTFYPLKDGIISTNQNNWIPPTCVILENIFCQKCSQNGDLDVSNDFGKGGEKQGKEANNNNLPFLCPHCGSEYPLSLIEEMLVERVSKMQTSFALQDWQCVSCKKIGANFLHRHCECSNKFEYTLKPEELIRNLEMVKRVAIKHRLENLEYVIEHVTRCLQ